MKEWVAKTNAIGLKATAGRYGETYAYKDNVALFGMTAKQWGDANSDKKGNIRDYANVSQLVCLSNMENINALFIGDGIPQGEGLKKLNAIAISQMKLLTDDHRVNEMDKTSQRLLK